MNRTLSRRVQRVEAILLPRPIREWSDAELEAYLIRETQAFAREHGMTVEAAHAVFEAETQEIMARMKAEVGE